MTLPNPIPALVIDDDPVLAQGLAELLEPSFAVTKASSAEEALALMQKHRYIVAMVDVLLPGPEMAGLELLKVIKLTWPETEVIMVTGVDEEDLSLACMQFGAYEYVLKPFKPTRLRATAHRAAEKWELKRLVREMTGARDKGKKPVRRHSPGKAIPFKQEVREFERELILAALQQSNWKQVRAAKVLGLHLNSLRLKIRSLGIPGKRDINRAKR